MFVAQNVTPLFFFLIKVLKLARQMRFYGSVNFLPCLTDFPTPRTSVSIYALNKELVFRYPDLSERSFRVTRMRTWRITTIVQVKRRFLTFRIVINQKAFSVTGT